MEIQFCLQVTPVGLPAAQVDSTEEVPVEGAYGSDAQKGMAQAVAACHMVLTGSLVPLQQDRHTLAGRLTNKDAR